VVFDNTASGTKGLLAKVSARLAIASSTIAAGASASIWLAELLDDGVTYGDGRIATAGAAGAVACTPPWAAWATIDFGAGAAITAINGAASGLILPYSKFSVILQNNSGFALAASGHTYLAIASYRSAGLDTGVARRSILSVLDLETGMVQTAFGTPSGANTVGTAYNFLTYGGGVSTDRHALIAGAISAKALTYGEQLAILADPFALWYDHNTRIQDIIASAAYAQPVSGVSTAALTSITESPSGGFLNLGSVFNFTLTFSAPVTVAGGTPTLSLNDGGTASYVSGSGSASLVFKHTVGSLQNSSGLAATAISLNGATIKDGAGSDATLSLTGIAQAGPVIDTTAPAAPVITGGSSSANVVTLTGTAEQNTLIAIKDGGTTIGGTTASGAGGAWSFTSGALSNGSHNFFAQATDAAGNIGQPSAAFPMTLSSAPSAAAVASIAESPVGGNLTVGAVVNFTLTFSGNVTVAGGTPSLTLNDGGSATYTGGSGTAALTFSHTVGAGNTAASLAATAVNLNGATIKDGAGNAATLTLTGLSQSGPVIDTTPPAAPTIVNGTSASNVVTLTGTAEAGVLIAIKNGAATIGSVTADGSGNWTFVSGALANGSYSFVATATDAAGNVGADSTAYPMTLSAAAAAAAVSSIAESPLGGSLTVGATVNFTVTFSAAVTVAGGTPTLTLNDGGSASYVSGSGTAALVFTHVVAAGQNATSLAATAVALNGATIKDGSSNNATLDLSGLTQVGPRIDTTAPDAPVISGGSASANVVTLTGSAEAGALIEVKEGGAIIGATVADSGGAWTFTSGALSVGSHTFYAFALDAANNISDSSTSFALSVTAAPPPSYTPPPAGFPIMLGSGYDVFAPDALVVGAKYQIAEVVTLAGGQGVVVKGSVVGKITASGKYAVCTSASSDGSKTPLAIVMTTVDTSAGDIPAVIAYAGIFKANALTLGAGMVLSDVVAALVRRRSLYVVVGT